MTMGALGGSLRKGESANESAPRHSFLHRAGRSLGLGSSLSPDITAALNVRQSAKHI